MESHWDLDSVLEQCCSKLTDEDLLPPLTNAGEFGWLDEKADLSAWTELDLPDELAGGMAGDEPLSTQGSLFYEPKLQSQLLPSPASHSPSCPSDPMSPTFPSPPVSPLNSSPFVAPARSQLEEFQLSFADAFYEDFAVDRLSLPSSPPTNASPPPTPVSAVPTADTHLHCLALGNSGTSPAAFVFEPVSPPHVSTSPSPVQSSPQRTVSLYSPADSPQSTPSLFSTADSSPCYTFSLSTVGQQPIYLAPIEQIVIEPELSVRRVADCETSREPAAAATVEMEVVVEDDDAGVEEYTVIADGVSETVVPQEDEPQAEVATAKGPEEPKKPASQKRKKRGSRRVARESVRKERKRLQNKDAATRYRQRKKQLTEHISTEYTEQFEENCKLKAELERISNEISYLKGLMRDLCKAKGLL